jgi:hypothetical protein
MTVRPAGRLAATSLALAAALAGPLAAHAALAALGVGQNGPYSVASACEVAGGVATNGNQVTWEVVSTSTASASNGAVALDTVTECSVNGTQVVWRLLPGPVAAGAGSITLPAGVAPNLTTCGEAFFNDGGFVSSC